MKKSFSMQNVRSLVVFCAFALALVTGAQASAKASFGAEFNFSNVALRAGQSDGFTVNSPASEQARDMMKDEVLKLCGECKAEGHENAYGVLTYRIRYPDGWYFEIATDPSVVEIQTKPSTTNMIQKNQERIQKHIFDAAKTVGLLPASQAISRSWAASHIHVGALSALGTGIPAAKLLKNFMVDFSNHSELALGVFTFDTMNAPPLAMLPETEIENFKKIAADVDSGKIRSINTFARRIRSEVYDVSVSGTVEPTTKYQAFNVNRIGNDDFDLKSQTFEIRAMRGQESALDYLILTRLIEARLEYIKTQPSIKIELVKTYNEEQRAEKFYRYVVETGLDFTPYEKFLTPQQKVFLPGIISRYNQKFCQELFAI